MPRISPRLALAQQRADGQGRGRLAFAQRRLRAKQLASDKRLEARYVSALVGVVRCLHDDVTAAIVPKLSQYAKADGGARADAVNPFSGEIDGIVLQHVVSAPRTVSPLFARHAADVASANAQALRVVGIRPTDLRLGGVISTARDQSIQLVEKAMRSYASDVRELFENPATFGMRVEDIKEKLLERGNVSDSRAELIARDQTLKLNSAITKTRQGNVGITKYTWSTSLDERVRPEHAALEGQTFDWTSPPIVGHPGEDFQCRCVAVPVIDGLGDLDTQLVGAPETPEEPAAEPSPPDITEGLHVGAVDSTLSQPETKELLSSIGDDETRAMLATPGQELGTVYLRESGITLNGDRVDGSYSYADRKLSLAATRPAHEVGWPFVPGKTFKVSSSASTVAEAAKIDLRHELGHHIHGLDYAGGAWSGVADNAIFRAYQQAKATDRFITEYARENRFEYWAESYAAYFHRNAELKTHDPNGFAMVEGVLKLKGAKTK